MSISPLITFKAGMCDVDSSSTPLKIKSITTPGYLYLFEEDELIHFCWRPRSESMSRPELDLVMVPSDGRFVPYTGPTDSSSNQTETNSPTNGRIFALKFQSSTQRYFFWLQSKSQHSQGDTSWFSPRDLKLGDIVNRLLQGDQVNASEELNNVQDGEGEAGGDAEMEDAPGGEGPEDQGASNETSSTRQQGGSTGAGGGAAPTDDTTAAVQNFLRSMQGNPLLHSSEAQTQSSRGQVFTTLQDLLPTAITIPFIDTADEKVVNELLSDLPPVLILISQGEERDLREPSSEIAKAALDGMDIKQKKDILRRVLRSPQFVQSLGSLTTALREGGLPSISDALKIPVANGGLIRGGAMPLGGGDAVEAFVEGVRTLVQKTTDNSAADEEKMETD